MIPINPILAIDAYKFGHMSMHIPSIASIYINMTPRSMNHFNKTVPSKFIDNKLVAFGMQMAVQDIVDAFNFNFFNRPLEVVLDEFITAARPFIGENVEAEATLIKNVSNLHGLGYLPLLIKALPEGTISSPQIPTMTAINTLPGFGWLPNYLETFLSQTSWKASTAATTARLYRRIFEHYSDLTCDNNDHIKFQGHDFSARGMSGTEDSIRCGIAHITQFWGSDSVHAVYSAEHHYGFKNPIPLAFSVPATEHSIMQLGISLSSEEETFRRLLTKYNTGIISIVSDTDDYWNTISVIASNLKPVIEARQPDSMGLCKTVFRPDSGNPIDVICGINPEDILSTTAILPETANWDDTKWAKRLKFAIDRNYPFIKDGTNTIYKINNENSVTNLTEAEVKGSLQILWDIFGGTINDKGFKVLNPKVGLIYGDSITPQRANDILARMADLGFAASNIVFGIGSYAYNYSTRDSLGFAVKATAAFTEDGTLIPIQKTVKTDKNKLSAKGLLRVDNINDQLVLHDNVSPEMEGGLLQPIFKDGEFLFETNFETIRERASK